MNNKIILGVVGVLVLVIGVAAFQMNNSNTTGPLDLGNTFMAVDECAQHANTSQLCKQIETREGVRWQVTSNENFPSPQPAVPIASPIEIRLSQVGDFQFSSFQLKDSILTYSINDAKSNTVALTPADLIALDVLLGKYKLETLHNDSAPPPDARQYVLTVIEGGVTKISQLSFSLPQNPGYVLAAELEGFFGAVIAPVKPCGSRENCATVVKAAVANGCAPWDGVAVDISMPYNGGTFYAELFAEGLQLFEAGKPVIINETGDSVSGTGNARFCPSDTNCVPYLPGQVHVDNPSGVVKPNTTLRLNIIINGAATPIEARWDNTAPKCG